MQKSNFENLNIWQKSVDFAKEIYVVTSKFPKEETYGVTSQIRRSSISIASNIAEGAERQGVKEFIHFLHISRGSIAELKTQLIIVEKIGYIQHDQLKELKLQLNEIHKMLNGLIASLKKSTNYKPPANNYKPITKN